MWVIRVDEEIIIPRGPAMSEWAIQCVEHPLSKVTIEYLRVLPAP